MGRVNKKRSRKTKRVIKSETAQESNTSDGNTNQRQLEFNRNQIKDNRNQRQLESKTIEIKDNFQCGSCRYMFHTKEELKEHFTKHFIDEKYVCESCGEHFKVFFLFHDHCTQHIIDLYCMRCRRSFENAEEFEKHQEIHLWDCNLCYEKFNEEQLYLKHMDAEHGIESIRCEKCPKYFSSKVKINHHYLKSHQDEKSMCSFCSKSFATIHSMRRHIKQKHLQQTPFTCDTCDKEFNDINQLRYHEMEHSGNYTYECPVCGKGYALKRSFKSHMQSHLLENTDLPFCCILCEKRFNTSPKLTIHMKSHSDERPYKCDICPDGFKFSSHLKRHKESHTKGTLQVHRSNCPKCSLTFKTRKELKIHTKIHHTPKNFECADCSLDFEHLRDFARHAVSHTEGSTFSCKMCEKSFSKKMKAVVHLESHFPDFFPRSCSKCSALVESREKLDAHSCCSPYTCKVCNTDLKNRTRLLLHMTKHTAKPALHCPLCLKLFRLERYLKKHVKLHLKRRRPEDDQNVTSDPLKPHKCELCGKAFRYPSLLQKHFMTHSREKEEKAIVKNIIRIKKLADLEVPKPS